MAKLGTLIGWIVMIVGFVAVVKGLDLAEAYLFGSDAPQALEIDGQSAIACHGATVRADGGWLVNDSFRVDYTDTDGLKHTYRGVRKLRLDDVPKTVKSTVPVNASYTDGTGKDYVVGNVYTWADGSKGKFLSYDNVTDADGKPSLFEGKPIRTGTHWEPVDEPNPVCASGRR